MPPSLCVPVEVVIHRFDAQDKVAAFIGHSELRLVMVTMFGGIINRIFRTLDYLCRTCLSLRYTVHAPVLSTLQVDRPFTHAHEYSAARPSPTILQLHSLELLHEREM